MPVAQWGRYRDAVRSFGSACFQRRDEGEVAHFLLVTLWGSMESVKRFAGEEPEIARYYPEDDEYLLRTEKHSTIYRTSYEA